MSVNLRLCCCFTILCNCLFVVSCSSQRETRPKLESGNRYAYLEVAYIFDETDNRSGNIHLIVKNGKEWRFEYLAVPELSVAVFHSEMNLSDIVSDKVARGLREQTQVLDEYFSWTDDHDVHFYGSVEYKGYDCWKYVTSDDVQLLFYKDSGEIALVYDEYMISVYLPLTLSEAQWSDLTAVSDSFLLQLFEDKSANEAISDWSRRISGKDIPIHNMSNGSKYVLPIFF